MDGHILVYCYLYFVYYCLYLCSLPVYILVNKAVYNVIHRKQECIMRRLTRRETSCCHWQHASKIWSSLDIYRVGQKKRGHRLMTIILPNLNRFTIFLNIHLTANLLRNLPVKKFVNRLQFVVSAWPRFLAHLVVSRRACETDEDSERQTSRYLARRRRSDHVVSSRHVAEYRCV